MFNERNLFGLVTNHFHDNRAKADGKKYFILSPGSFSALSIGNKMPILRKSSYQAPPLLNNGHLQTIYPSMFRKLNSSFYSRERIHTDDDDFLDIDWSKTGGSTLAIISHGLEGNSNRPYVVGMAKILNRYGLDVLAWNYRSCSGEINRQLRFYHNGSIDDLERIIQHALSKHDYERVILIGFSLGGNLTLVYLGKKGCHIDKRILKAVVFSVPCDLKSSSQELSKFKCKIYMRNFLKSLHQKIRYKMELMPNLINDHHFHRIKNFKDYDDRYTAPLHGFENAEDYWKKCSSRPYVSEITIPTLIVNALDDPFLADGCYPTREASDSKYVYLEIPDSGGHVGFIQWNKDGSYWSEKRTIEFIKQKLN